MSDTNNDPPNLGLLIKLMGMTTSRNDGEALAAVRKANEQLVKFGGSWEELLLGKVTVIGDPFAGLEQREPRRTTTPPPPPRRPAPPPPPYTPPPRRPASPPPNWQQTVQQPAPAAPASTLLNLMFKQNPFGNFPKWTVRSDKALNIGQVYSITKRNGQTQSVVVGQPVGTNGLGEHFYSFQDAGLGSII